MCEYNLSWNASKELQVKHFCSTVSLSEKGFRLPMGLFVGKVCKVFHSLPFCEFAQWILISLSNLFE